MSCLWHYGPALLRFWFQTYLGHENSASYLKIQAEKTFSYHGHALITLYFQFLWSDWSKFDRWVHAENLCSVLKLVYFDSWSWQSFVSTYHVFNCLFPLDVENEIQLLSRVLCYSWLVCLLGFWLRNASLVKVDNPISGGIVFVFHVREFELSHSNSVNRIIKITHAPNLHVKVLDFFPFTIRT